ALDLTRALHAAGRADAARAALRRLLDRRPDHAEAWIALAGLDQSRGDADGAAAALAAARRLRPDDDGIRLVECVFRLPVIAESVAALEAARAAYAGGLAALAAGIRLDTPARVDAAVAALGARLPFQLPYHGRDDRDLQALHGGLAHRIMAARYPALIEPTRPPAQADRLRVGILSAHFRRHSNWWMPIRGWLQGLDPRRFELFGYHTGTERDNVTLEAERRCAVFRQGLGAVDAWAAAIRGDGLHALLIPEVGMDAMVFWLAALRLAPHQAASWGHPETTGLPTVDAFLSSEAMEPADGERHYTERLVRLPGLSVVLAPPDDAAPALTRDDLGIGAAATVFWCCQNISKYLPEHDDVFPRIAAGAPDAVFAFVGHHRGPRLTAVLRDRLARAFARHGMAADRHCLYLRPMTPERFRAVTRIADVFLDAIGWSGCNSAIEAIDAGLPIVTHAGALMRGRHSTAFLRTMGIEETIAGDVDGFVARAVALGRDRDRRAHLRAETVARRGRLYEDASPITGLARHLETVAA
ncbi:MAG: tetratricopeptide repeat protein, partial [Alphaproteobacteria bacterium]